MGLCSFTIHLPSNSHHQLLSLPTQLYFRMCFHKLFKPPEDYVATKKELSCDPSISGCMFPPHRWHCHYHLCNHTVSLTTTVLSVLCAFFGRVNFLADRLMPAQGRQEGYEQRKKDRTASLGLRARGWIYSMHETAV